MNISDIKKYFFSFCGAVSISLLIVLIYSLISTYEMINQLFSSQIVGDISVFAAAFIIILILCKVYNEGILINSYKRICVKNFLEYNRKNVILIFSLLLISLLFAEVTSTIISNLTNRYNYSYNSYHLIYIIGTFTCIPIIEELIFRGLFFNIAFEWLDMKNNTTRNIVVICNIIMFLSLHYRNYNIPNFNIILSLLISFLPRLLVSISLSYIYIKTKDIKYNIILHMLYNLLLSV